MIVPRSLARRVRAVFRRCLTRRGRDIHPQVAFLTGPDGLRVRLYGTSIAAEFHQPGSHATSVVAVSPEVLTDIEGRRDDPVHIEEIGNGRIRARWQVNDQRLLAGVRTTWPSSAGPRSCLTGSNRVKTRPGDPVIPEIACLPQIGNLSLSALPALVLLNIEPSGVGRALFFIAGMDDRPALPYLNSSQHRHHPTGKLSLILGARTPFNRPLNGVLISTSAVRTIGEVGLAGREPIAILAMPCRVVPSMTGRRRRGAGRALFYSRSSSGREWKKARWIAVSFFQQRTHRTRRG